MKKRSIFILGDSISIHYGPFLKAILPEGFAYDRKRGLHHSLKDLDNPVGANGGDSRQVLEYLDEEYRMGTKYDVLLINCGLHDIRRLLDKAGIQVPLSEYSGNIDKIANLGLEMSEKMIWIDTTPVIDQVHNSHSDKMHRFESDLAVYRSSANWIMSEYKIPVIDLHAFTEPFGSEGFIDHVHFTEPVREKQAEFIKNEILKILGEQS